MKLSVPAFAKLNLTLDVLGKREDGYHEMCTIMVSADLSDEITLETETNAGIRVKTNLAYIPNNMNNLAARSAELFISETGFDPRGLDIEIKKNIPVCAGMAGGSSDAAAVLRALNEYFGNKISQSDLAELGKRLGADVPYCVCGGTVLARGIGDRLTFLKNVPEMHLVICKPGFSTSTPEAFAAIDKTKIKNHPDTQGMLSAIENSSVKDIAARIYNVFEPSQTVKHRELGEIRSALLSAGAMGSCLSGSGPSMYGIFKSREGAQAGADMLKKQWKNVFTAKTV